MASIIINNIGNTILPNKIADNISIDNIDYEKRIIICIFKDIPKKEIDILKLYGNLVEFSENMMNIDPQFIDFDFLILDFRKDIHINYYQFYFYKNDKYYYILYRFFFETNNGLTFHNEMTEFPPKQLDKINYKKLLLQRPINPPKWYVSLFRTCFSSEQELF
jgi:hypothetical protein